MPDTGGLMRRWNVWHSSKHCYIHTCLSQQTNEKLKKTDHAPCCAFVNLHVQLQQGFRLIPFVTPAEVKRSHPTKIWLYKQEICNPNHVSSHSFPSAFAQGLGSPSTTCLFLPLTQRKVAAGGWDLKTTHKTMPPGIRGNMQGCRHAYRMGLS